MSDPSRDPKSPGADGGGGERKPASGRPTPPLWRLAFDAVERPLGAASETWVQSDVFMDTLAATWKVQRRVLRGLQRPLAFWLGLWDVPRRSDVNRLVTQVAQLERQVRQVTRELERERRSANGSTPIAEQRPAATTRRSTAKGGGR